MHRRHRSGFIIVFGHRTLHRSEGVPPVQTTCPGCQEPAQLHGRYAQRWFTLFFIPVFPLESRESCVHFTKCARCKGTFNLTIDQLARKANVPQNDHASAMRLYNELRDDPADGERLLKLLSIYAQMNDLREAESSARAFPAAFANEPRCAAVLDQLRAAAAAAAPIK